MMIKMAKLSMTWRAVILESRAFDSEISFHDRATIVEQGISGTSFSFSEVIS